MNNFERVLVQLCRREAQEGPTRCPLVLTIGMVQCSFFDGRGTATIPLDYRYSCSSTRFSVESFAPPTTNVCRRNVPGSRLSPGLASNPSAVPRTRLSNRRPRWRQGASRLAVAVPAIPRYEQHNRGGDVAPKLHTGSDNKVLVVSLACVFCLIST